MNSVVIQPDNLTIEKDDQVSPRWYQIVYDPPWISSLYKSPHHSDLFEDCSIEEAEGVELDADSSPYRSYSRKVNLTGRAIVGINVHDVDLYRSEDEESHFKFKIYACDQD